MLSHSSVLKFRERRKEKKFSSESRFLILLVSDLCCRDGLSPYSINLSMPVEDADDDSESSPSSSHWLKFRKATSKDNLITLVPLDISSLHCIIIIKDLSSYSYFYCLSCSCSGSSFSFSSSISPEVKSKSLPKTFLPKCGKDSMNLCGR